MKELIVNCNLYFDLLSDRESQDNAVSRLLELLNENDIACNVFTVVTAEIDDSRLLDLLNENDIACNIFSVKTAEIDD